MGVPLNHPFCFRIFPYKPSSYWGTPIYGTPPNIYYNIYCIYGIPVRAWMNYIKLA